MEDELWENNKNNNNNTQQKLEKIISEYDPSNGWCAKLGSLSHNVRLILLYTLISFAGRSIWTQQISSIFVYNLANQSTETLGYVEAVGGLCFPFCFLFCSLLFFFFLNLI